MGSQTNQIATQLEAKTIGGGLLARALQNAQRKHLRKASDVL